MVNGLNESGKLPVKVVYKGTANSSKAVSYTHLDVYKRQPKASWARYIFGVCREMIKRGVDVKGFDTAFAGHGDNFVKTA